MSSCSPLYGRINNFLINNKIDLHLKKLLACVSGGADSVFLLKYLRDEFPQSSLTVLHINYGLRGTESDAEAIFVENLCHKWETGFIYRKTVLPGGNIQKAARAFRLQCIRDYIKKHELDYALTGHHADDLLETALLKLLAGSGAAGIASFSVKKSLLLRPLLCLNRREIETDLKKRNINFCIDSSNAASCYRRNYLRNRIFPLLDEKFSSWRKNFYCSIENLRSFCNASAPLLLNNSLVKITGRALIFITSPGKLTPDFFYNVIYLFLRKNFPGLRFSRAFVLDTGRKILATRRALLLKYKTTHCIWNRGRIELLRPEEFFFTINTAEAVKTRNSVFRLRQLENREIPDFTRPDALYFSGIPQDEIILRSRKNGDALCYLGMSGSKKLKDIIIDRKISCRQQQQITVLQDKNGNIIGVFFPGSRHRHLVSSACAVTSEKPVFCLERFSLQRSRTS
ncbi:MAG: tRNA lysidine(34) synthetase TilS [Spirochaetes bacterium GWF1_41_5]|nr:MAG: tRNA lysidine(34) synthetase TilS [Spirochaetes bacterium GWF1_41_5]HBE03251.1 tRNA lysidine(34) synthetase TilS [Spirochaetia bacterium]